MVVVVYSFGTEPSADALRAAGVTVRREPVTGKELARLIVASKPVPSPDANGARAQSRLYSADCASRSETDAALHQHLYEVTSVARTMFEQALARVVIDEGLAV